MFDDWKNAWREAVENFEREVRVDDNVGHGSGMRRQLTAARGALAKLDAEIQRASAEAAAEREAEQVCMRRQTMAADIEDKETVRIAGEYALRHAERASIYERKAAVLQDERALMVRDIEAMEAEIATHDTTAFDSGEPRSSGRRTFILDDHEAEEMSRHDRELARMKRERAATEKLEELKRRMRGTGSEPA